MERNIHRVSDKLNVKGQSAESLFISMIEHRMFVNRCYQRKLVWDLQENQLFIDSLLNKYPVPSIILSEYEVKYSDGDAEDNYEIIDGLQRLNAIALFMQSKFPIVYNGQEMYFDLHYCPGAEPLVRKGILEQGKPVLPYEVCNELRYAELPVVVTTQRRDRLEKIELIFNRINSQGRKLSSHDIRQANNIGPFADLVRRVATIIRCDYTYDDRVDILDMPKISLKNQGLEYGVDPNTSFWIRHKIFQFSNFRQSKDEELLASTIAMCLLGKDFHVNAKSLDILYDSSSDLSKEVAEIIEKEGKESLQNEFSAIINQIDAIFTAENSTFSRYLFNDEKTANKDICFSALFYALFALHRESFEIDDYAKVAQILKQYCEQTFAQVTANSSYETRQNVIDILLSTLCNVMSKQLPRMRTEDDKLLEELLSLSSIELQMVEFKIGLTYFHDGTWNMHEINKIGRTLVAMANTNHVRYSTGYVIVGVADDEASYSDWNEVYHQNCIKFGRHCIVGIQAEAARGFKNVDEFVRAFSQKLSALDMSSNVLDFVLENMRVVDFHGKDLLILPVCHTGNSKFEGERYRREFNKTVKVSNGGGNAPTPMAF